jgi:hypothetical protein
MNVNQKSFQGVLRCFSLCGTPVLAVVFCFILSCKTADTGPGDSPEANGTIEGTNKGVIAFTNKTAFTVHIIRGSGGLYVCTVPPGGSNPVDNIFDREELYYPRFDIPLTADFSLTELRPADKNLYYQIDNTKSEQEIIVTLPSGIDDTSSYMIFSNNSSFGGISLLSPAGFLSSLYPQDKRNINGGETVIYRVNPRDDNNFQLSPGNQKPENIRYRPSFVYSFTFDGAAVTLADARPLHRIGEPAWSFVIPDAEGSPLLVPAAGEITGLFVPSPKGILQYAFDSKGETEKNAVPAGENFDISAAARTGGGVLLAGYSYDERAGGYTPVVQKQRENGAAVVLAPSTLRDRRSAWFSVIAEKTAAGNSDPVWLVAGGADSGVNTPEGYKAYVRAFADGGTTLNPLWETGPGEFDARAGSKGPKCGAVRAAVHDPARDRWLLTGGLIEQDRLGNPVKGSYIAELDAAGEIVSLDFSFPGFSFNKMLLGQSGRAAGGEAARYLAGEEQRAGETRAVLVKYNPPGREMWRFANHPGHSFYQDAVLDEENGQIVLAGTLGAGDETGTGGRPFIEGVDLETGTLLWREELSALKGAVLVTGIVKAPDYGFVLSLSGIRDGFYGPPYMAARVNARGRLLNHTVR